MKSDCVDVCGLSVDVWMSVGMCGVIVWMYRRVIVDVCRHVWSDCVDVYRHVWSDCVEVCRRV